MARGATAELAPEEIRRRHAGFIRHARMISTEISQLPLRTVIALLLFARANSIPTVLDVDLPPDDACPALGTRAELERALRLATILKPARSAARALSGGGRDTLKLAQAMRARYQNQAVVVTDGERGCAIAAADTALKLPAFAVKVIDTTGAGDAFMGAMLAGLGWALPWRAIGTLANAAGAVCVGRLGAFPTGFEHTRRSARAVPRSDARADAAEDTNARAAERTARSLGRGQSFPGFVPERAWDAAAGDRPQPDSRRGRHRSAAPRLAAAASM